MKMKNQTEIQLMKILFKTSGKKPTKNITSQRAYPHGIEQKYYRELRGFFKPLTDYVNDYISKNMESLLRGDSGEIRLDAIPGETFRGMIYNLEKWLSVYMPDISSIPDGPYQNNNVILTILGNTADEAMEFGNKEFSRILEKGIHVNLPTSADWWEDMRNSWAEDNYTLITSNAKNYISKINTLTEQAIVNGMSPGKLKKEIMKATEGLSEKHCKLLARDQMGKLNGQITQAQMEEVGLELYVWSTAYDDRVRDSHALMEGLLCRWDDASVCSYDNGKTWVPRPSGAVDLHPGQDIQCRCIGLAFYPELVAEVNGEPFDIGDTSLESPSSLPTVDDESILSPFTNYSFTEDVVKNINSEFKNNLKLIEDVDVRKYVSRSFKSESISNNALRYVFNNTVKKMNPPYFVINPKHKTVYDTFEKLIKFSSKESFGDKKNPIHELMHAFSELNKIKYKPLSRQENFKRLLNEDFSELLKRFNQDYNKLNKMLSDLAEKDWDLYLPIADIVGGKQGKRITHLSAHSPAYWAKDPERVFDEAFAILGQGIFDPRRSTALYNYFPKSYNNMIELISDYIKGDKLI